MRLDPSGFDSKGGMQRVYTIPFTFVGEGHLPIIVKRILARPLLCGRVRSNGGQNKMQESENISWIGNTPDLPCCPVLRHSVLSPASAGGRTRRWQLARKPVRKDSIQNSVHWNSTVGSPSPRRASALIPKRQSSVCLADIFPARWQTFRNLETYG